MSDFDNSSFLTTNNFQTQFGREVVFENELILNSKFKDKVDKLNKKDQNINIWRWQHYSFDKDILRSMKIAKKGLNKLNKEYRDEFQNFEFKII